MQLRHGLLVIAGARRWYTPNPVEHALEAFQPASVATSSGYGVPAIAVRLCQRHGIAVEQVQGDAEQASFIERSVQVNHALLERGPLAVLVFNDQLMTSPANRSLIEIARAAGVPTFLWDQTCWRLWEAGSERPTYRRGPTALAAWLDRLERADNRAVSVEEPARARPSARFFPAQT